MPGWMCSVALALVVAVAAGAAGLKVYDFSDPTQPVLLGECDTPGNAYNLTLVGELAFIADGYEGGLQIVEISDPTDPQLLGGCATPGGCFAVAANDKYAYSAEGMSGIAIIDITDPYNPQLESVVYDTYYPPWDIRVEFIGWITVVFTPVVHLPPIGSAVSREKHFHTGVGDQITVLR